MIFFFNSSNKKDKLIHPITVQTNSERRAFSMALINFKKQLNAMVEVIKVIDLTTLPIHMKEILYAKVFGLSVEGKTEAFQISQVFNQGGNVKIVDIGSDSVLFECTLTERKNNELIALLKSRFKKIEVTRGGAVAVESISSSCR